jgi:predicted metal-dependent phosphotriesterase family hydrolase
MTEREFNDLFGSINDNPSLRSEKGGFSMSADFIAMKPVVETMTGPIPTSALGFTLMHEHIIVRSEGMIQNFPHIWDQKAVLDCALKMLTALKAKGVSPSQIDIMTRENPRRIFENVATY